MKSWTDCLLPGDWVYITNHKGQKISCMIIGFDYNGPDPRVNLQGENGLLYSKVKMDKLSLSLI